MDLCVEKIMLTTSTTTTRPKDLFSGSLLDFFTVGDMRRSYWIRPDSLCAVIEKDSQNSSDWKWAKQNRNAQRCYCLTMGNSLYDNGCRNGLGHATATTTIRTKKINWIVWYNKRHLKRFSLLENWTAYAMRGNIWMDSRWRWRRGRRTRRRWKTWIDEEW